MLVGEQPGDKEDLEGHPFVGPAGRMLQRGLDEAGLDRAGAYVTNAVKHFRYKARGKRRIHQRPAAEHLRACRPWLDAELAVVEPDVLICLGAVAVESILGKQVKVTKDRGRVLADTGVAPSVVVTVHPSSILRSRDDDERHAAFASFVDDLRVAAEALA
jgi:uracil-DNA glycosylase